MNKLNIRNNKQLYSTRIDTPLGLMLAIADDECLYVLEFLDQRGLDRQIARLKNQLNAQIIPGDTTIARQVSNELVVYFSDCAFTFETPYILVGSTFQQTVWQALSTIPPRKTASYSNIAEQIGRKTACRAVANAIGANPLAIIIPCHRVINKNGNMGGYAGGLSRKKMVIGA